MLTYIAKYCNCVGYHVFYTAIRLDKCLHVSGTKGWGIWGSELSPQIGLNVLIFDSNQMMVERVCIALLMLKTPSLDGLKDGWMRVSCLFRISMWCVNIKTDKVMT